MSRNGKRIVKDAAWVAYRKQLTETEPAADSDQAGVDTPAPAPVTPDPTWYRATLWPDADLVSGGNGGWWDEGSEPSGL